jgi:transposase
MSIKKYKVTLTENELDDLKQLVSKGKVSARKITHAQILLHANEGTPEGALKDTDIAKAIHISRLTVERVRKRFVEEGLESALNPKVQIHRRPKKLDGEAEAFLVATACSNAPEGFKDWTLKLLSNKLVECEIVDSISIETVRQTLKKTNLNLG